MNSTNNIKKQSLTKTILIILAIIVITLTYFTLMYIVFKPNVLTWWSDEYEYISQARNFALFSKLETSFYSAKAVLYGNFPSFGYHPILYSFLAGLFLKVAFYFPPLCSGLRIQEYGCILLIKLQGLFSDSQNRKI